MPERIYGVKPFRRLAHRLHVFAQIVPGARAEFLTSVARLLYGVLPVMLNHLPRERALEHTRRTGLYSVRICFLSFNLQSGPSVRDRE
jgi:hypothetical protein